MRGLKEEITSIAKEMGIDKVGFTSRERLEDAPPSGDLGYVLPSARSAISLCVAFDKTVIRPYLSKQEYWGHIHNHKGSYAKLKGVAKRIQSLLEDKGCEAAVPLTNLQWRQGQPFVAMIPPLSHKYVAVASGIGWLGWSGMVLTPEYGATIALLSVVTSAELEPDPPVEGDFCQNCRLCVAVCPTRFMSEKEEDTVTIAGRTYTHNKKHPNFRCAVTCGGSTGVNAPTAKWSTWSPRVLDFSGCDDDQAFKQRILEYAEDPKHQGVKRLIEATERGGFSSWEEFDLFYNVAFETCGNCMLICWPEMEDRRENYRLLTTSGRVMKSETGRVPILRT